MGQGAAANGTFVSPSPQSVFSTALSNWLLNPTFPNGITLGDGSVPSFSPSTGAMTAPATNALVTIEKIPNIQATTQTITATGAGVTITFPTAYPTTAPTVIATCGHGGTAGGISALVSSVTTTGFVVQVFSGSTLLTSGTVPLIYAAIGLWV
jgi:hypothetical protein